MKAENLVNNNPQELLFNRENTADPGTETALKVLNLFNCRLYNLPNSKKVDTIAMREVDNRVVFSVEVAPGFYFETNQDFSPELAEALLNTNTSLEKEEKIRMESILKQRCHFSKIGELTKICLN